MRLHKKKGTIETKGGLNTEAFTNEMKVDDGTVKS